MIQKSDLEAIITEVINRFLIPKFGELEMNASGEWLDNLGVSVESDSLVHITGRSYTEQLVKGTAFHYVPIAPLKKWAMAKFGMGETEATSMAFAVSNKIKIEGTKWHQEESKLLEVLDSPECVDFIRTELSKIYSKFVELEIKKAFKWQ